LLTNTVRGYCLLYPEAFSPVEPNSNETVLVIGDVMNHTDARASIQVSGADGQTTTEAADQVEVDYSIPDFEVGRSTVDLGGEEAVLFRQMPGQEFTRRVVAVRGDQLYVLSFTPADPAMGDPYTRMEELYNLVVDSFTFIEPS
jgi:hypothetical protein